MEAAKGVSLLRYHWGNKKACHAGQVSWWENDGIFGLKPRPGSLLCEPHRTRTCNQGIKSTRNGRCTIPTQGLLPAMRLLRWCASSLLDFSVCHEPKRCKQHYTRTLLRVNGKFGLCRDPSGDRKLAGGRRATAPRSAVHSCRHPQE